MLYIVSQTSLGSFQDIFACKTLDSCIYHELISTVCLQNVVNVISVKRVFGKG